MSDDLALEVDKLKGLNTLLLSFLTLLENERAGDDYHAVSVLYNGYCDVHKKLVKVSAHYEKLNQQKIQAYVDSLADK